MVNNAFDSEDMGIVPPVIPAPADSRAPCAGVDSSGSADVVGLGYALMDRDAIVWSFSLYLWDLLRTDPSHHQRRNQNLRNRI